ncbi:TPA: hypothetical protein ACNUZQ_004250, partial [Citrobacter braakii]
FPDRIPLCHGTNVLATAVFLGPPEQTVRLCQPAGQPFADRPAADLTGELLPGGLINVFCGIAVLFLINEIISSLCLKIRIRKLIF